MGGGQRMKNIKWSSLISSERACMSMHCIPYTNTVLRIQGRLMYKHISRPKRVRPEYSIWDHKKNVKLKNVKYSVCGYIQKMLNLLNIIYNAKRLIYTNVDQYIGIAIHIHMRPL